MKRKRSKLIGLVLMISAILLQVGYAATASVVGVKNTEDYAVQMESQDGEKSEYVDVNIREEEEGGVIVVEVGNLYPGAYFTVLSKLTNVGKRDVEFKSADIRCLDEVNKELYESLVFYDEQGEVMSLGDYKTYLNTRHSENVFKVGESQVVELKMGLSPEVTDLENTTTRFVIEMIYEQNEEEIINPGGGGSHSDRPEKPGETITPPVEPPILENPVIDVIPPIEPIDPVEPLSTPEVEESTPEEAISLSTNRLPKTGGISALFIYGLGLTMLGGGISIYRKGKRQE